jgi:hypothetical protein
MRPMSDHQASGREMLPRTAKSCGPDAPTLASSLRSGGGPTGLRQNLIRKRRWQETGHRGERDISRKTIACGNAGRFRCTRCYSCAFYYHNCTRDRGCNGHPAFPTPSKRGRKINARLGRIAPRGRDRVFEIRATSLRAKQSNQFFLYVARWIASSLALLAMTVTAQIHPSCPDLIRAVLRS